MQTSVGQLHLRLHADDPHDATPRRLLRDVLEQGRLTNARLAAQNLHRALSRREALQLSVKEFALVAAASQQRTPKRPGPRTRSQRKRLTRQRPHLHASGALSACFRDLTLRRAKPNAGPAPIRA